MTTLTSPHDLLAAVPFLVGYHPEDSLVVIALREEEIGMAMRIDFPREADPDQIDTLANYLVREKADSALIVAYLPDDVLESEYIIDSLRSAIEIREMSIHEILEVKNERWRSTLCGDEKCCPPHGNPVPEMQDSRIVAEQVIAGKRVPFENLQALKESLAPLPLDPELKKLVRKVADIDYEDESTSKLQREGAHAVDRLAKEFIETGFTEDKALVALVLSRLQDLQVRDYAMGITNNENIDSLAAMWHWMLRRAPKNYVAPVATLFAAVSYERGDGAMAGRALDRAFEDDITYPMAKLLRRVFAAGWPPQSFATMRAELHPKICASLFGE